MRRSIRLMFLFLLFGVSLDCKAEDFKGGFYSIPDFKLVKIEQVQGLIENTPVVDNVTDVDLEKMVSVGLIKRFIPGQSVSKYLVHTPLLDYMDYHIETMYLVRSKNKSYDDYECLILVLSSLRTNQEFIVPLIPVGKQNFVFDDTAVLNYFLVYKNIINYGGFDTTSFVDSQPFEQVQPAYNLILALDFLRSDQNSYAYLTTQIELYYENEARIKDPTPKLFQDYDVQVIDKNDPLSTNISETILTYLIKYSESRLPLAESLSTIIDETRQDISDLEAKTYSLKKFLGFVVQTKVFGSCKSIFDK